MMHTDAYSFPSQSECWESYNCFPSSGVQCCKPRNGHAKPAQPFQQFNWMLLGAVCGAFPIRKGFCSVTSNVVKTIWLNFVFSRTDPRRNYKRNVIAFLLLSAGGVCSVTALKVTIYKSKFSSRGHWHWNQQHSKLARVSLFLMMKKIAAIL